MPAERNWLGPIPERALASVPPGHGGAPVSAADAREELEARLHQAGVPAPVVKAALPLIDAYAKALAREKPKAPPRPRVPAIHLAAGAGTACLPYDLTASRGLEKTPDPAKVTCGHCVRTATWLAASTGGPS